MTKPTIYTVAHPEDLSPPLANQGFCVDVVLASDYAALESRMEIIRELAGVAEKLLEEARKAYQAQADELAVAGKTIEKLAAENVGLKDALAAVVDRSNEPDYQSIGMGCGVEDNGLQTDGYNACEYGWREAMERIYSEVIPESLPETPATDAALAGIRAQGVEMFVEKCREKAKQAVSSDIRDNWWLAGEHADDFAQQLRGEATR